MRQRRWLELVKDYDCEIHYHLGKANVVADALSRKKMGQVAALTAQKLLWKEFERLSLEVVDAPFRSNARVVALSVQPTLRDRIKSHQKGDQSFDYIKAEINTEKRKDFTIAGDDALYYQGRLCVPNFDELRQEIIEKAHSTPYSIHPGSTKMYHDLKPVFWWRNIKNDIAKFVKKCLICQQVKVKHQQPSGLLQSLEVPEWK